MKLSDTSSTFEINFAVTFRQVSFPDGFQSRSSASTELLHFPCPKIKKELTEFDHRLLELINEVNSILKAEPENWNRELFLVLKRFHKAAIDTPASKFAEEIIPKILNIVKESFKRHRDSNVEEEQVASNTIKIIHAISNIITKQSDQHRPRISETFISLEEISTIPNVKVRKSSILITNPISKEKYLIPIPKSNNLLCKGGAARLLLKLYAGAPLPSVLAELPLNDIDFIVCRNSKRAHAEIKRLHSKPSFTNLIDPEATESITNPQVANIFASRDMTINSCFLSSKGLHFSDMAYTDCKHGRLSALTVGKDLYGADSFYHHGVKLLNKSGMMRFIKTLAEQKGLYFDIPLRNNCINMGTYWLVLARRFMHKENASELMQNAYEIGKQCGQVKYGERNIFDVLNRAHSGRPDFSFTAGKMSPIETSRWLMNKLLNQISRSYRKQYGQSQPSTIFAMPEDEKLIRVSLPTDRSHYMSASEFHEKWKEFLECCEKRQSMQFSKN